MTLREQAETLLSAATERVSSARCSVITALIAAKITGAGWRDESVQQARAEFIRAGAAHAAARQLLRELDARAGAS